MCLHEQCAKLVEEFPDVAHFSAGDLLRDHIKSGGCGWARVRDCNLAQGVFVGRPFVRRVPVCCTLAAHMHAQGHVLAMHAPPPDSFGEPFTSAGMLGPSEMQLSPPATTDAAGTPDGNMVADMIKNGQIVPAEVRISGRGTGKGC